MDNRPQGREKNITGQGKGIKRRGEGVGTGPVGRSDGYAGRTGTGSTGAQRSSGGTTRSSGGGGLMKIIIALVALLGGGGVLGGSLLGGSDSATTTTTPTTIVTTAAPVQTERPYYYSSGSSSTSAGSYASLFDALLGGSSYSGTQSGSNLTQGFSYADLFGSSAYTSGSTGTSSSAKPSNSGWVQTANTGKLDTSVAKEASDKRTVIKSKNNKATIMVYMCGTDLESKSAMGSKDLQEMVNATIGKNVNLIVYTGGCTRWQNNIVSSSVNQIYKIESGKMTCLEKNAGNGVMTNPKTLSSFITYCTKNYPANRNMLILWDHGGGSISGYGYDEKNASSGSMTLQGLNEALSSAGATFDFIGYDACLMATVETALTMAPYADYLIASEESEPGVGWYYTNWLTALSENTGISTLELGKKIVDDFVDVCAQQCRGQQTTLSVVDLAELTAIVPESFKDFSTSTLELIQNDGYSTVSSARSSTREFAASSRIDQIDLVNLAVNLGTDESKALAKDILSAVKYNRTSTNMTNAFGLSIYFPYQKTSTVGKAVATYDAIGIDSNYSDCIKAFATYQAGGQSYAGQYQQQATAVNGLGGTSILDALFGSGSSSYGSSYGSSSGSSGSSAYSSGSSSSTYTNPYSSGYSNPYASIFGSGSSYGSSSSSGSSYYSSSSSSADIVSLLTDIMGSMSGMSSGRSLDMESAAEYLQANRFNADELFWQDKGEGSALYLSEEQWALVRDLELNIFVDDGEGLVDLGLDNTFAFTESGGLSGEYDGTWIAIDGQEIAYYHIDSTLEDDSYTITGRVPVLLNGTRADLILVFDSENPYGYIAGARFDYVDGETDTIAKLTEINVGDTIDYLADYYGYNGEYTDTYMIGDQVTYTGEEEISNVYLSNDAIATYLFKDIYNNEYWTPVLP